MTHDVTSLRLRNSNVSPFQLCILMTMIYGFFATVAASMAVIHDDECQIGEVRMRRRCGRVNTPGENTWQWLQPRSSCSQFTWRR